MKKQTLFAVLSAFLAVSCFSFGVYECLDSYHRALIKCLSVYDDQKRQDCYWAETENFRASLEAAAADKSTTLLGTKVISVGFFRNEIKLVSACESFSVPSTGTYYLTVLNGNPHDRKGRAETCALLLWDGKVLRSLAKFGQAEQKTEKEIALEAGKTYLISADEISPVASYVITIISDRKLNTD